MLAPAGLTPLLSTLALIQQSMFGSMPTTSTIKMLGSTTSNKYGKLSIGKMPSEGFWPLQHPRNDQLLPHYTYDSTNMENIFLTIIISYIIDEQFRRD